MDSFDFFEQTATFDTFHPFRSLPIKLQEKIWNYALESRVVEVQERLLLWDNSDDEELDDINHISQFRQSRNAVLPYYPLCFQSELYAATVRFNASLDVLYLDTFSGPTHSQFFGSLSSKEVTEIKYLAISNSHSKLVYDAIGEGINKLTGPILKAGAVITPLSHRTSYLVTCPASSNLR